jgi:glycolate oxidase
MDRLSMQTTYDFLGERLPHPDAGAMLLIEVDGQSENQVEAEYNSIVDLCVELEALDVFVGDDPAAARRIWRPRQSVAEALKAVCPVQSLEDVVVPVARIPDLVSELARLSRDHDVLLPCYGHAGDGNLHATIVKRPETPLEEWRQRLPVILGDLYEAVFRLGGTISGEHGVGSKRARYLPLVQDETLIDLQRRIKRAFDPKNILNPGKIFPAA